MTVTVNSSTTYFSKIKKFIMFMALAAQLFLFFTVTVSYIRYRISITNDIVEFQQNHYNTQLNSLFMKIDNMILQFDNSKATELCSVNIMKMSTDELEEKYETMCKNLVSSPLTERYFSGYWVIGTNSNYLTFSNIDGKFSDSSSYRLDYSYLFGESVSNNFIKNYQKIFIFNKENIPDVYIPVTQTKLYNSLFKSLMGKPIYFTFHRGLLCIFILNDEFFDRTFAPNDVSNTSIVLESNSGDIIYSRFHGSDSKKFKDGIFKGGNIFENNYYTLHTKNHIKITLNDILFLLLAGIICILTILNTRRLAKKYSHKIMEPYNILNNFFRLSGKEKKVNKYDYSKFSASIKKRSEISVNCFFAVLNTMVIPTIIALVLLSVLLNFCTQHLTESFMSATHYQLKEGIYNNIDFFITNTKHSVEDTDENSRLNYTVTLDENFKLQSIPFEFLQHLSYSDFNRQLKFDSFNLKESALININKDFFGDQALALVYPQNDGTYKLNVIKSTVVENTPTYGTVNFIITDHNKNTITQSTVIDDNYKERILQNTSDLFVHQSLFPEFEWKLYTFSDNNLVRKDLYSVIWFNFIIIFAFLVLMTFIGWYYSIFFVRPIEHIMSLMSENNMDNDLENMRTGNNEIDEMFYLYNNMIDHIKEITNEKILLLKKEEELRTIKQRAELIALQQQINPHFIFNTLEILSLSAMKRGDYYTSKIVSKLSTMFRYPISRKRESAFLYDEIQNIQNYLDIWDMRFPGRYKFIFDVEPCTKIISMPKLILQPIVENCMLHAFDQIVENCVLKINAQKKGDYTEINITDNGRGMDEETLQKLSTRIKEGEILYTDNKGIGLCNVYQRLLIFYGRSADMTIESSQTGGTTVTLKFIPKQH